MPHVMHVAHVMHILDTPGKDRLVMQKMGSKEALSAFLESFAHDIREEYAAEIFGAVNASSVRVRAPSASYMEALAQLKGASPKGKPGPKPKGKPGPKPKAKLGPVVKGKPGPKPKAQPNRQSGRRAPEEMERLTKELLAFIQDNPGTKLGAAAESMGVHSRDLTRPLKLLKEQNLLVQKGIRGASTYKVK